MMPFLDPEFLRLEQEEVARRNTRVGRLRRPRGGERKNCHDER